MRNIFRIARKEIGAFFSSLAALIFVAAFLGVCLFVFFWVETFFARNIADVRPLFEWMPLLLIFLVAALTMRQWSEERRVGTLEVLLTSPVPPVRLVLGKFVACMVLVLMALALTLPLPITVAYLGPLDWGPVIGGYIATLCLAAAYVSIGLYVSARTENQIVSLMVTALICGGFYMLGADALTRLFGNFSGAALKLVGSGSRFESITRGVIDLRDLYYYLSIVGTFLVLNVYALERLRWSEKGRTRKHLAWRLSAGLLAINLLTANAWLHQVSWARADLTEGSIYSVSETTRSYLRQLQEPLLIRGYFSAQTHPLLAPLVPRLNDLLKEYEIAGEGRVRVEIVDPIDYPEIEEEAGRRFSIQPVPFQTQSKYGSSVTNSYFDILILYGDQFETLDFNDLIEVKATGDTGLDVELRNPEYDITRAIKRTLSAYRATGDLIASLPAPATLEAYISETDKLPDPLPQLRQDLDDLISEFRKGAQGKFSANVRDPDEGDGSLAQTLQNSYNIKPHSVAAGLVDRQEFWFHLIWRVDNRIVQVALPEEYDKDNLKSSLEAGLKRFAPGALRTVGMFVPEQEPAQQQGGRPQGLAFSALMNGLRENAAVEPVDLTLGRIPESIDLLFVVAPEELGDKEVFAIDQFVMRGGTVILSASPYKATSALDLQLTKISTGLEDWLSHNGVWFDESLVLDPQNSRLPVQVERQAGNIRIRQVQMMNYPYFVEIRREGLEETGGPTTGLDRLTFSWASAIELDDSPPEGRVVIPLVNSSGDAWTSTSTSVVPDYDRFGDTGFPEGSDPSAQLLGVSLEGSFDSYFVDRPSPLAETPEDEEAENESETDSEDDAPAPVVTGVIGKSPESARIIVLGSSSFLSDGVLQRISSNNRSFYQAPITFATNVVDWSLEDRGLLDLRTRRGNFARTLDPIEQDRQVAVEYGNYGVALLGVILIFGFRRGLHRVAARRFVRNIQQQGA